MSETALHTLLSPDGYYTYLGIDKTKNNTAAEKAKLLNSNTNTNTTDSDIDIELVNKNYRRLSLKHHPDRRGGDADTFRILNRAKKVLTTPKLRKQYDLIGLDLHDEEEEQNNENDGGSDDEGQKNDDGGAGGSADSVISQLASATLASVLQVTVRTALMCVLATFVTRFKLFTIPILCFLSFVSFKVKKTPGTTTKEVVIPLLIAFGVFCMFWARLSTASNNVDSVGTEEDSPLSSAATTATDDDNSTTNPTSTWLFFFGELITINMFFQTSIPPQNAVPPIFIHGLTIICATVSAFVLQGRFWRYAIIIAMELGFAILTVLIFPVMEMILEEIINEKLRKVGERVRATHAKQAELMKSINDAGGK
eukprot:CAMPEP_0178950178 /NCGR_PEP_ID=MMETSP0789-20121207/6498_1 /TAXON_ID=3005 /ORGANISM="Rhizosolenia setigera, Strain CCMP 1694" /LENGTH=366 /DNA_ID=CAMNT_0020630855 /DNA_START=73 /DNA_END=1173 /DNA_ORIENTATION=+